MDVETPQLKGRLVLERDIRGLRYSPSRMCRSRRSMKRDESKDTYKLPHRLIEKKRRDRINECIAQLKDLLPEHLKLTTLGHLEKAVVLELTLKHVKTLTALTEQQHQKIVALQNGARSPEPPPPSNREAFYSGFQACTEEASHYLAPTESSVGREQRCAQLLGHLHALRPRFPTASSLLIPTLRGPGGRWSPQEEEEEEEEQQQKPLGATLKQETLPHCVPVIQRTQNWSGSPLAPQRPPSSAGPDTDTDSGYGGECERKPTRGGLAVKQEPAGNGEEAPMGRKRGRWGSGSPPAAALCLEQGALSGGTADPALLSPLIALGLGSGGGSLLGQSPAAPFCLPFCFIAPSALPWLEKLSLGKAAAGPLPFLYPGISVQAGAAFPSQAALLACRFSSEAAPAPQPPPNLFPPPGKPTGLNPETDRASSPQPVGEMPLQNDI